MANSDSAGIRWPPSGFSAIGSFSPRINEATSSSDKCSGTGEIAEATIAGGPPKNTETGNGSPRFSASW
ncbi:hypothetical protein D3C76_1348900 [compost metagenome]